MTRILHVITGLNAGGAERMLVRLVLGLDRQIYEQRVVSLTSIGVFAEAIKSNGVSVVSLGMTGILTIPIALYRLTRVISEFRPDIVQTWLYHSDLLGLLAARLAGHASVVWNIRCAALAHEDVSRYTHWLIYLLARISPKVDAIVFNSIAGQCSHEKLGYRARSAVVITNGFDLQNWQPDSARRRRFRFEVGVSNEVFLVGLVARIHQIKDHRCFLEAAKHIVLRTTLLFKFILVGKGANWNNKSLVDDIDKLELRHFLILLDSRQDIESVMSGLDCLVLTSTSEGFPNVIGEAMASGVPCVSTDAGDARIIIGDTGYIVSVGDFKGVANGIQELAANSQKDRSELAVLCRKRIAENFHIEKTIDKYAGLYKRINEQRKKNKASN